MNASALYSHQYKPQLSRDATTITIASLPRLSREDLAVLVLADNNNNEQQSAGLSTKAADSSDGNGNGNGNSRLAIIDVRDSDYIGGHIRGCTNVPSGQMNHRAAELVRTLRGKDMVVFHCALSQQRGPGAALLYLREKARLDGVAAVSEVTTTAGSGRSATTSGSASGSAARGADRNDGDEATEAVEGQAKSKEQKVYVLDGGFVKWQEKYGEDERLTEGYVKDIWEDVYY